MGALARDEPAEEAQVVVRFSLKCQEGWVETVMDDGEQRDIRMLFPLVSGDRGDIRLGMTPRGFIIILTDLDVLSMHEGLSRQAGQREPVEVRGTVEDVELARTCDGCAQIQPLALEPVADGGLRNAGAALHDSGRGRGGQRGGGGA